jgi:vacuolar-type H+-ATPase subunit H
VDTKSNEMQDLSGLTQRVTSLEVQVVQLRDEMRAEFSATRAELRKEIRDGDDETRHTLQEEIRANDEETRRVVREEIRAGDEETRTLMRVLHEYLVARIALIQPA